MSKMRANIITVGLFGAAALLPLNAVMADQVGSASWYALNSRTASGEQMDPSAMTAAHPSLPFGTKVLVENLSNGHSVVVRINDRGPFVAGRIIDVSKAAASSLGMLGSGTANVRVTTAGGGAIEASTEAPRGFLRVASRSANTVSASAIRKRVASAYSRAQSTRNARALALASASARAASARSAHKDIVLASAETSYGVLPGTPGFMDQPSTERRSGSRRAETRLILNN
jgi:rare lipoprotein A